MSACMYSLPKVIDQFRPSIRVIYPLIIYPFYYHSNPVDQSVSDACRLARLARLAMLARLARLAIHEPVGDTCTSRLHVGTYRAQIEGDGQGEVHGDDHRHQHRRREALLNGFLRRFVTTTTATTTLGGLVVVCMAHRLELIRCDHFGEAHRQLRPHLLRDLGCRI
jgi:hypothetical protein